MGDKDGGKLAGLVDLTIYFQDPGELADNNH
jgi:hypothetical protein